MPPKNAWLGSRASCAKRQMPVQGPVYMAVSRKLGVPFADTYKSPAIWGPCQGPHVVPFVEAIRAQRREPRQPKMAL